MTYPSSVGSDASPEHDARSPDGLRSTNGLGEPPVDRSPQEVALAHQKAGRLNEAEAIYRRMLTMRPGEPGALHGLGLVNHQAGRHEEAAALLRRAVEAAPRQPVFRSNLAAVLGIIGRHAEATAELRHVVRMQPGYADGWRN